MVLLTLNCLSHLVIARHLLSRVGHKMLPFVTFPLTSPQVQGLKQKPTFLKENSHIKCRHFSKKFSTSLLSNVLQSFEVFHESWLFFTFFLSQNEEKTFLVKGSGLDFGSVTYLLKYFAAWIPFFDFQILALVMGDLDLVDTFSNLQIGQCQKVCVFVNQGFLEKSWVSQ